VIAMRKISIILVVTMSLFACKKDNQDNSEINIEEQKWFIDLKTTCDANAICFTHIVKSLYKKDTVYYSVLSGPLCDPVFHIVLLNQNGIVIKEYNYNDISAFNNEVEYIKTVYRCEDHIKVSN
jgi:hypothetical protein